MDGCFSQDYVEAREKFTIAARAAGAELTGFALDQRGRPCSSMFAPKEGDCRAVISVGRGLAS
jgi:Protein of unknown function (DUF2817)